MLFNRRALDGIAAGEIDLAFRRWKKPTVKAGGTLRSRAGFATKAELLRSLRPDGRLYRIKQGLSRTRLDQRFRRRIPVVSLLGASPSGE